jgi:hypothetical protein
VLRFFFRGEDAVGDGGGFYRGTNVMRADDVGAGEDGGYVGCGGCVEAVLCGGCASVEEDRERRMLRESVGEEALAGGSGEDGQFELVELVEVREERVVFVEAFAEAEAGVEDDPVAWDAGGGGGFETFGQAREDEREDLVRCEGRERGPVLWAASRVHQDGAAVELRAGRGHLGVPEMAADVVDDLCSGLDSAAGGACVKGVDGEDGVGLVFEDGFDGGEDAGLFLVGGERRGVGTGGLAADVEDVCALVEHLCCLCKGAFGRVGGRVEEAAVGEGVGCDVEDAHDEGSPAKREGAGAEMPVVMAAGRKGHGGILDAGSRE